MAPIATADQQQSKELAKKNNNIINNNKRMTEKQETGYLFPSKFRNVYRKFLYFIIIYLYLSIYDYIKKMLSSKSSQFN